MKGLVAVLAALCAQGVSAQWGPWTQWWSAGLGAWQGDTAAFAVAESDWLLLDAPAAGIYALWREGLGSRPARFSASLQMNFNPSSANYAFWEVGDSSGTPSPFLTGYRLELGRSNDQLRLLRMPDGLVLANSPSGLLDRSASRLDWSWDWDSSGAHRLSWVLSDTLGVLLDSGQVLGSSDSSVALLGRLRFGATVTATRVRGLKWGPMSWQAGPWVRSATPRKRAARLGDASVTEILVSPDPRVSWRSAPGDFMELFVEADSLCWASGWVLRYGSSSWLLRDRVLRPGEVVVLADGRLPWPDSLSLWDVPISLTSAPAFWSIETTEGVRMAWGRVQPDMHQPMDKSLGGWSLEVNPQWSSLPRAWQSSRSILGSSPGSLEWSSLGPRQGGILGLLADSALQVDWRHPLPLGTSPLYPFDSLALARWSGGRWSATRIHSERTALRWLPDADGLLWPCRPGEVMELPLLPGWIHADGTPGDCTVVYAGWAVPPVSGELQISELLLNPLPGEGRFAELRSLSDRVLDLSGLFWSNPEGFSGDSTTSPSPSGSWRRASVAGRFLLPGQVLFIAANPAALLAVYSTGDSMAGPLGAPRPGAWARPALPGGPGATNQSIPLTDDGGILELRRSDGLLIDRAEVSPDQFPERIRQSPGKGEGMALERRGPDPKDWGFARIDSATPGRWPKTAVEPFRNQFDLIHRQWPPILQWDLDSDQAWLLETRWTDPEGRWASPWSSPQPVAPQDRIEAREEPPQGGLWLWELRFTPSQGRTIRRAYPIRF